MDGTFERDNGDTGVWLAERKAVTLRFADGTEEKLEEKSPDSFESFTGFFKLKRTSP